MKNLSSLLVLSSLVFVAACGSNGSKKDQINFDGKPTSDPTKEIGIQYLEGGSALGRADGQVVFSLMELFYEVDSPDIVLKSTLVTSERLDENNIIKRVEKSPIENHPCLENATIHSGILTLENLHSVAEQLTSKSNPEAFERNVAVTEEKLLSHLNDFYFAVQDFTCSFWEKDTRYVFSLLVSDGKRADKEIDHISGQLGSN